MRTRILGTGSYVPPKVLTNADLEKIVDTSDEWIKTRSGVVERRIAEKDVPVSELALPAARNALEMAGIEPEQLDVIIVGTVTPDYIFPTTACILQNKLGTRKIMAYDQGAGCTGFIYAVRQADAFIRAGLAKYALAIGAEELTKVTNWDDRTTCVLFGDGAGAVVIGPADDDDDSSGILATYAAADGSLGDLLYQPAGGSIMPACHESVDKNMHTIWMNGNEVFKYAVRSMEEAALKGLELSGVQKEELDWLIPHQANIRIIDFLARRLKLPMEKVVVTINKYGNTSAASIPISLDEAIRDGRIERGQNVILVAFGAGFTWGSVMFRW